MRKTVKVTQKTTGVNKKTEGGSLYQNHRNTRQTDGRTILSTGTGVCLLVTILESKEREKGSTNDSESSLERETEAGMETETEADGFFFCWNGLFCEENRGLCFSMGGGDHFLNGIRGGQTL
jgi:hypothetical protein